MIKIKTPLRWVEDERSGSVTLIADDGAVILHDDSREVMPEWLDEITRAVNAHETLVAELEKAHKDICSYYCPSVKKTGEEWTHSERCKAVAAALAKAHADG